MALVVLTQEDYQELADKVTVLEANIVEMKNNFNTLVAELKTKFPENKELKK